MSVDTAPTPEAADSDRHTLGRHTLGRHTLGRHTLAEIVSQPDTWAAAYALLAEQSGALAAAWQRAQPRQVVFTGCGSTYHLARSAAAVLQGMTGVPARGIPASEVALHPAQTLADPAQTLLVALSRSGTTTETAAALDSFRRAGGRQVWGITCTPNTPIADESDFVLLTDMAQEQSVAQTRSFSTMLFVAQGMAAVIGGAGPTPLAGLPDAARRLIELTYGLARQWGTEAGLDRFFYLGGGPLYGVACEAALKMKEMSISHSEAYHVLEFRHGPKALLDDTALVVGLLGKRDLRHEAPVLQEAAQLGATTLALVPGQAGAGHVTVHLPEDVPWWAMPVLYLPVVQVMALARAQHKGINADAPRNLSAAVHLDRASFSEGAA